MPDRKSGNKTIIIILVATILAISFLSYKNYREYANLQTIFENEKIEMEKELTAIIADYDNVITKKRGAIIKFQKEREKVLRLKDTIKSLKQTNVKKIKIFRERVSSLERINKKLIFELDSLEASGYKQSVYQNDLTAQLHQKENELARISKLYENLEVVKKDLEVKIRKASVLHSLNFVVTPMKTRGKGKLKETIRAKHIELFKISLDILKNEVAKSGDRKLYIQVLTPERKVLNKKEEPLLLNNGQKVAYTNVFTSYYENKTVSLVNLITIKKGTLTKGNYVFNVFLEGERLVNSSIKIN